MITMVQKHHQTIAKLCQQYQVKQLDLFGSATSAAFDPQTSDLDFIVAYRPEADAHAWDCYWGLKEDLEKLFARPIDLVDAQAIKNPFFLRSVNASRENVYGA